MLQINIEVIGGAVLLVASTVQQQRFLDANQAWVAWLVLRLAVVEVPRMNWLVRNILAFALGLGAFVANAAHIA